MTWLTIVAISPIALVAVVWLTLRVRRAIYDARMANFWNGYR